MDKGENDIIPNDDALKDRIKPNNKNKQNKKKNTTTKSTYSH